MESVISARQRWWWFRAGSLGSLGTLAFLVVHGCGQTVEVGFDDTLGGRGTDLGGGGAGAGALQLGGSISGGTPASGSAGQGMPVCVETKCRGIVYQCGNCADDDGDGLIDALDPDCLGPCDDDEAGLSTGLTTSLSAACRQDCYFDGDNGPGNDKCLWSHSCDPLSVPPNYPPSGEARCKYGANMGVDCTGLTTTQPQACLTACLPLVPNGCDCFGCCELPGGSGKYHFLGAQRCQRDKLDDAVACPACTPVPSCFNDCAKCETCVDKAPDPSCKPESACSNGGRVCAPEEPCDVGDYCVTGCCVQSPPK